MFKPANLREVETTAPARSSGLSGLRSAVRLNQFNIWRYFTSSRKPTTNWVVGRGRTWNDVIANFVRPESRLSNLGTDAGLPTLALTSTPVNNGKSPLSQSITK